MAAELTVLRGGRGLGPGTVVLPRTRLVEDAMENFERWRVIRDGCADGVQHLLSMQRLAEMGMERERERAGQYDGKGAA